VTVNGLVSGNFEFASLIDIESEEFWSRYGGQVEPTATVRAHIFNANLGGGQHALETQLTDLTTGQSGFMIASAANGFMVTNHVDCSGTPFNYQPEFSTASPQNAVSWAALQTNVATQFEIGHFTPCTNVVKPTVANLGGGQR
jgi:hypothetical protein